jgi:hypothetical protein
MAYQCWGSKRILPSSIFLEAMKKSDLNQIHQSLKLMKNKKVSRKEYEQMLKLEDDLGNNMILLTLCNHLKSDEIIEHQLKACYKLTLKTTQKFPLLKLPFPLITYEIEEYSSIYYFPIHYPTQTQRIPSLGV